MPPRSTVPRRPAPSRRLWLLIGVPVALLLLLVAALFGLRLWAYHYLRGEAFRRQLDEHASNALQAEGRFDPLEWQDAEVYSGAFDATGEPGSPLARLAAEQVRARFDLGALWRRAWRVDSVELTKFDATLADDRAAAPRSRDRRSPALQPFDDRVPPSSASPPPATNIPPDERPGFLAGLLPNRFEIGEVRVGDFSLAWNAGHPADAGRLRGVTLTGRPLTPDNRSWQIEGRDGQLSQAYFPALRLTGFTLRTTPHEVFITRAEGQADVGGKIELSGTQALDGDRALDLRVDFDGLPAAEFLPADWRARLKGSARGSVHVTNSADDAGGGRAAGHVELRDGRLTALPLLNQLALFTASERYRSAELQNARADFDWNAGNLVVSNLLVESEGLIRTEGGFTVRANQIDGTLQLGLARSAVRWLPVVGARVFSGAERDGYLWTTVHLTGPVNHPSEDLTPRLLAATQQEIIDKAKEGTTEVIDTAKGLLDLLKTP